MCVCAGLPHVKWRSWSMSTQWYIFMDTECNCCRFSLCLSPHPHCLITCLLTASYVLPLPLPSLSTLYCLFFCFSFHFSFPVCICLSPLSSPVFPGPFCPFRPTSGTVWHDGQETGGLSTAAGCGRHGEDARARLEVCVYVPAGVLPGPGDKGSG